MKLTERLALCWRILHAKPGNLMAHADMELPSAKDDDMQSLMNRQLRELVLVFSTHGHSGFSASYARQALGKLLAFEPLRPLTGAPDEWYEVCEGVFQNRRCWRDALAAPDEPAPSLTDKWRDLALKFDRHRMAAMWHLRALLADPGAHAAAARAFLDEPPPPAEPVAVAVPVGWKLVPAEPTREMLVAINWPNDPSGYRAMLAASPAAPAASEETNDAPWTGAQLDEIARAVKDQCGPATAIRVRELLAAPAAPAASAEPVPAPAIDYAARHQMAVTSEWCRGWDDCRAAMLAALAAPAEPVGVPDAPSNSGNPPKLKPCPFCGKRPTLVIRPENAESSRYFAAVACYCGGYTACAHKMVIAPEADEAESLVTEAWNTRSAQVATPAAPAAQAWQPIETAPKDGRKIMLSYRNRNGKPRSVLARWLTDEQAEETDADGVGLEGGWYECIDNWDEYTEVCIHEGDPTHWMPLPAAPAGISQGGE